MAEINETPEIPGGEPGAEQPVSAEPAPSTEQPVNVQPEQVSEEVNKDARMWAMFCHLAGLAGLVVPVVGCIVGPLIFWQIKKDDFPFVDEQGKEAVNFQISMLIYGIVAGLLCFACVGFVLAPAVAIFDIVFLLIATVKANDGQHYRYPLCIRFIK
ncbi:MAG: DUF4870 domain-containing protein [Planctomycetota bacterium]|jgi:uncharacterized Tic20 family protein